ncbi:hypothetical protein BD626DRAFT_396660 [Schizophyllum amplum]|uniref:Fungal-type protein kinase domain-containing protein n=1 Tax=Schizophyllum amplum TaxID=97359 RepID=A0A550CPZ1_9AGAR|nr:hypothetical protein BD626DRAFT_396660 [Auriculariopsis ampla]
MENLEMFRKRQRNLAANGKTRVCEPPLFFKSYTPDWKCLSDKDMKKLTNALISSGAINKSNGQWHDLPMPESKSKVATDENPFMKEDAHFAHMEAVVENILSAAERTLGGRFKSDKRTTRFVCRPRHVTYSEVPGSSQRADSLFVRKESSYPKGFTLGPKQPGYNIRICTADITNAGEFKLDDSPADILDDQRKSLGHAGHIFYNDVGRGAVFTFTIERSRMQIWYHTRSHTGVTTPFDIYENKEWFIEFVLFNTYAQLWELGIDPTVRRVFDKSGNLQYQFDIYPKATSRKPVTYETKNILDESSARTMYSRAMRVFDVRLVKKNSENPAERVLDEEPNVLRDYWVYDDVPDERTIQDDIKKRLEEELDQDAWTDMQRHFMVIKEDGVVRYPRKGGVTRSRPTVPPPPAAAEAFEFVQDENPAGTGPTPPQLTAAADLRSAGATQGHIPTAPRVDAVLMLRLHGKKHCRTVYKQLCKDLYNIDNPALFFHALSQVVMILRQFKLARYLHRDGSPGNFLLHHLSGSLPESLSTNDRAALEQWVTIVSDLEYARPYHGGSGHDPITGTPYYVAVEVQSRRYCFEDTGDIRDEEGPEDVADKSDEHFSFNYYHDLESALWMAIDFVVRKISQKHISGDPAVAAEATSKLREYAALLFTTEIRGSATRLLHITYKMQTKKLYRAIRDIYGKDTPISETIAVIQDLQKANTRLQAAAVTRQHKMENGRIVFDHEIFDDDIYHTLETTFRKISHHYIDHPDTFVKVPPAPKVPPPPRPPTPTPAAPKKGKGAARAPKPKAGEASEDVVMDGTDSDTRNSGHEAPPRTAPSTRTKGSRKRSAPDDEDEPRSKKQRTDGQEVRRSGRILAKMQSLPKTGRRTR